MHMYMYMYMYINIPLRLIIQSSQQIWRRRRLARGRRRLHGHRAGRVHCAATRSEGQARPTLSRAFSRERLLYHRLALCEVGHHLCEDKGKRCEWKFSLHHCATTR